MLNNLTIKTKLIAIVTFAVLLVSIIEIVQTIYSINNLNEVNIKNYSEKAYKDKKDELKNYTTMATKTINAYYLRTSKEKIKAEVSDDLQKQTNLVFSIIETMYKNSNGKISKSKLKNRIKTIVSSTRYGKNGYFWINDLDAKIVDHPIKPSLNGKNLSNFEDKGGKKIFYEFARVAKNNGDGFVDYVWAKPGYDKPQPKVSYVKLFKPFNWVIGTGAYVDDVSSQMKKEALNAVSEMRYGKDGYFWINDSKSIMKMHPIKASLVGVDFNNVKDKKGNTWIPQGTQEAMNNGGSFVTYYWTKPNSDKSEPKLSYMKYFDKWDIIIGTGLYIDDIEKQVIKMKEEASKEINSLILQILIGVIIMAFIIILIVLYISNTLIINPIKNLELGIKKLTNGDSNSTSMKIEKQSNDELGEVVDSFNAYLKTIEDGIKEDAILIEDVKRIVEEAKDGILYDRIEKNTHNKSLQELKTIFNQMLSIMAENICGDVKKIQLALKKYQDLDFTHRIPNPTGKTSQGLNSLADIINSMLVENKVNGLTLGDSSNILMSNVNTLNTNSNEAAAALEETAAALEQITSNISNNTDNVVKMSGFARQLTTSANSGEELANQTTIAMNEIDEQVTSINEAITVIDQIAFQTNILSLNAAVEAATAGEAGKGFAVVAQEVRNLAGRSAEAANEIKTLVQNATDKANNGKIISDKMIDGYHGLNENISKTIDLITDIESASKEQLQGIEQINDAVNSLDQQTQENAMIASQTHDVATQTDEIAKLVVTNANEKEFIGKDTIKAREMDTINKTVAHTKTQPYSVQGKAKAVPTRVVASSDKDEWESF